MVQYGTGTGSKVIGGGVLGVSFGGLLPFTLLSVDNYAGVLGIDPRHFRQMICNAYPVSGDCDDVWFQHGWQQADKASREDLANAIAEAERLVADFLGWWPAPTWIADEKERFPQQEIRYGSQGILSVRPGLWKPQYKTVRTDWSKFVAGGRERWSLLASDIAVSYSDPFGCGFNDLASVLFTYTGHPTLEGKEVFYVPHGVGPLDLKRFVIRGLRTTLAGGNQVYSEGASCKFADPGLWESAEVIDGDDMASFMATVDAYRRWTCDEDVAYAPCLLEWENGCPSGVVGACSLNTSTACLLVANPERGTVAPVPAEWGAANTWVRSCVGSEPDFVRMWYECGYPSDECGEMAPPLNRAVAALATALLGKPICGCGHTERLVAHWQGEPENPTMAQLACPWGLTYGALEAYQMVRQMLDLGSASV